MANIKDKTLESIKQSVAKEIRNNSTNSTNSTTVNNFVSSISNKRIVNKSITDEFNDRIRAITGQSPVFNKDGSLNIISKEDKEKKTTVKDSINDEDWLRNTFVINDEDAGMGEYGKWIRKNRYSSSAAIKFTSTSPGMGTSVNSKPQFTRYCDIRNKGKLYSRPDITIGTTGYKYGLGMGRYYSEAIDDVQQRIYLRFGTPQYMNILVWMAKSFDLHRAVLNNRGVITSVLLGAIDIASKVFMLIAFPMLSFTLGTTMLLMNALISPDKFVSVNDNMFNYWCMVENILNKIVVKRTLVPTVLPKWTTSTSSTMGQENPVTPSFIESMNEMIPGVIDPETGRISVLTLALRSQIAFNKMLRKDLETTDTLDISKDFTNYPIGEEDSHDTYFTFNNGKPTMFTGTFFKLAYDIFASPIEGEDSMALSKPAMNPLYTDEEGKAINPLNSENPDQDMSVAEAVQSNFDKKKERIDRFGDYFMGGISQGLTFAVFDVESTGSQGESFSNSTRDNPIESIFNSISSKSRNLLSNLNMLSGIPVVGDVVGFGLDAGALMLSNVSFGLANPLLALAYGATISLPKEWDSSSVSMPKANYKMKLISPYGNPYSQLFNIYLPLSMLMAGALPRSTGLDSHTSPFLCQLYDRGRVNIDLGIIDSFSITRGTSNLAFTRKGTPNAIDVDFSIANLNEIIAVDTIGANITSRIMEALSPNFGDTSMDKYIDTLTGLDVYRMFYRAPKLRLKLAERYMSLQTLGDASYWGSFASDIVGISGIGKTLLGESNKALIDFVNR